MESWRRAFDEATDGRSGDTDSGRAGRRRRRRAVSARRPRRRHVSDRRRRRLGGRARRVHPAPQAPPRRQRHGVRAHPAPRSHARELPARRAGQGHADDGQRGHGRHSRRAQPRLRDPARRGHRDQPRPADPRVARARRPTVAPVRRRLPPFARRRPRQPRDRRRAFGKRVRRHGGFAGHQGRERHHLRAGSGVGAVRRDAAQRGQRRCRRRRAGDSRARPRAGAPEPPPLRGSRRGPTGGRRRGRPRSDSDGRAQRNRRRLQRVQAGDGGAPAGAQDGASPRAGSAGLSGDRARGSRGGARPLRGHPHSRHLVLQGSGRVRGAVIADPARHPEGQAGRGADSSLGGGVLDRRRGVFDRDRAARAPGRLLPLHPDLRLRSERTDHRQGAGRHSTATLRCAM